MSYDIQDSYKVCVLFYDETSKTSPFDHQSIYTRKILLVATYVRSTITHTNTTEKNKKERKKKKNEIKPYLCPYLTR